MCENRVCLITALVIVQRNSLGAYIKYEQFKKKTVMVYVHKEVNYVHKEVNSIRIGSIYLNVSFLISGFQYIRENCLTPPEISVRPNEIIVFLIT